jgi:deoxyribonuclease V
MIRVSDGKAPAHPWPKSVAEARTLQDKMRHRVITRDRLNTVRFVAGVDVGFEDSGRITRAAVVVLNFPDLEFCDQSIAQRRTRFPYVPGYLSFREAPAVLAAFERLRIVPDLLLCDGQGYAHPRRFGIACHLGLLTNTPSIGVAKSRLIGVHGEPGIKKGESVPLIDRGETVGAVVRTRDGVNPLYISIGHRISLKTAINYVVRCTTKYRLPETTRRAHRLASNRSKS